MRKLRIHLSDSLCEFQATNFAILHKLTVELWPDESRRPLLFGPDPHSLHGPTGVQFGWIADWLDACKAKGVPVHAVTHHQCKLMNPQHSPRKDVSVRLQTVF